MKKLFAVILTLMLSPAVMAQTLHTAPMSSYANAPGEAKSQERLFWLALRWEDHASNYLNCNQYGNEAECLLPPAGDIGNSVHGVIYVPFGNGCSSDFYEAKSIIFWRSWNLVRFDGVNPAQQYVDGTHTVSWACKNDTPGRPAWCGYAQ